VTRIARRPKASNDDLPTLLTEFRGHKTMVTEITERLDGVKKRLMGILERRGVPDEKGSLWLEFDEPIAGYDAIKREKRSSVHLNEDKAGDILAERGLYEECLDVDITIDADQLDRVLEVLKKAGIYDQVVTVTERLSDDKIMQTYFAEKDSEEPRLTAADIDAMFYEKVTWAFVPREAQ
jgi:hypothetical protein